MADELRASDFAPLDFELDFGADGRIPPMELGAGEDSLRLTGIADRVDGWVHDGKLYLRVVDYKTGRKKIRPLRRVVRYGTADAAVPFHPAEKR
jgi:ATP-dependent helicase/nuclease subunit B